MQGSVFCTAKKIGGGNAPASNNIYDIMKSHISTVMVSASSVSSELLMFGFSRP